MCFAGVVAGLSPHCVASLWRGNVRRLLRVSRTQRAVSGAVVYYQGEQIFLIFRCRRITIQRAMGWFILAQGANIMAFRAKRLLVNFRRRLRRQEPTVGSVAVMLLAVTTVAVTYLYY